MGKDKAKKKEADCPVRLDRLLAGEGLGTRSDLKKAIRGGKALVNGSVEKDAGRQILPGDVVVFDGEEIKREPHVYYMLHKPSGLITATEDSRERTVLNLLREKGIRRRDLFPVGRLDRDTEGLLLVTDDGALAHYLLSPGKHVEKTYYAVVEGRVAEEDIRRFAQGLVVDEELTAMPADLSVLQYVMPETEPGADPVSAELTKTLVTIREGKYHQIKRMFSACGKKVLYLKRLSMGPLQLDPTLPGGAFRELTPEEISALREVRGQESGNG
ncbi:MAG: pseudouridine synthase [Eubacteriales bacterium]|nr:pseudouridine synthase [Eubacteriales bacterium]